MPLSSVTSVTISLHASEGSTMSTLTGSFASDAVRVSTSSLSSVSTARYWENSAPKSSSASRPHEIETAAPPSVRSLKSS